MKRIALAILLAAGCSGDGSSSPGARPRFVVSTGIFSDTGTAGYLVAVPSLEAGATYDLSNALELPSGANIFGGGRYVYVAPFDAPTITRWEVQDDGSFADDVTISFVNYGLGSAFTASLAPFVSDDKAYFVDSGSQRVYVWNPEAMTITGTIDLPTVDAEGGLDPHYDTTLTVKDGLVLAQVSWRDGDWLRFGERIRVVAIDSTTDTVIGSVDETRCNQLSPGGSTSDGTAYFSPASTVAPVHSVFGDGYGAVPCSLRIPASASSFDPAYDVDLSALVGGRPAGDLTMIDDDTAFIRVWHAELVDPATPENWGDVQYQAGFRWWRWNVGDAAAVEITDQETGASGVVLFRADGKEYATRYNEDFSATTLLEFDPNGTIHAALSGPGTVLGVVQVEL